MQKVSFPACFVLPDRMVETTASLYRPKTKKGDPRGWFTGLKNFCKPFNLLGIVTDKKKLYILNLSVPATHDSLHNGGTAQRLLDRLAAEDESVAMELLEKFRQLHRLGFVPTVTEGDTGVGMTAEHFLGIPPNAKIITMDYTMHFKENGKVRDHGYLFKIKPENVGLLFPDPVEYTLE